MRLLPLGQSQPAFSLEKMTVNDNATPARPSRTIEPPE